MWDLTDFRIVPGSNQQPSNAFVRITKARITLNALAIAEMNYPEKIQLLISDDANRVVVMPAMPETPEEYTIPFCTDKFFDTEPKKRSRSSLYIADKGLVTAIRSSLGWETTMTCLAQRFADSPNTLFFELSRACDTSVKAARKKLLSSIEECPKLTVIFPSLRPVICLPAAVGVCDEKTEPPENDSTIA